MKTAVVLLCGALGVYAQSYEIAVMKDVMIPMRDGVRHPSRIVLPVTPAK